MTDVKYQRDIINAFIDRKSIYFRRINPINPNSEESCKWHFILHSENFDFNFEEFEYQIDPPKKIKKWQWIYFNSGNHYLTQGFYQDKNAVMPAAGSKWIILGPALWTETEFDI